MKDVFLDPYNLLYFIIAFVLGIFIFILCKYRKKLRLPCSVKREGSGKIEKFVPMYGMVEQLVLAKTEGDGYTYRDVSSAPMFDNTNEVTINNKHYPTLKLADVK